MSSADFNNIAAELKALADELAAKQAARDARYPTDKEHRYDFFMCSKYWARVGSTEHKRYTNVVKAVVATLFAPVEIVNGILGGGSRVVVVSV